MPCDILRYHFLLLYIALNKNVEHLKEPAKADENLKSIIIDSTNLVTDTAELLTDLQNGDSLSDKDERTKQLLGKVGGLYKKTHINSIPYQVKQICLCLIGCILGITLGVIGIIPGSIAAILSVFDKRGTIGWLPLGIFIGGLLGYRLPQKMFQSENDAAMETALSYVKKSTQDILFRQKSRKTLKNKLEEKFKGILNSSSENTIEYTMKLTPATFMVKCLKKYLGNHLWIEIKNPRGIELGENQVIELGSPTPPGTFASYTVTRKTTPETLFNMLVEHQLMKKQKSVHAIASWAFWKHYKVGEFDCNAYVDQILFTTKQKLNDKLPRFDDARLPDFKKEIDRKWTVSLFFAPIAKGLAINKKNITQYAAKDFSAADCDEEVIHHASLSVKYDDGSKIYIYHDHSHCSNNTPWYLYQNGDTNKRVNITSKTCSTLLKYLTNEQDKASENNKKHLENIIENKQKLNKCRQEIKTLYSSTDKTAEPSQLVVYQTC